MFKSIVKSFSALLFTAALFYSCGDQLIQPPAVQETILFQKPGVVEDINTISGNTLSREFNTGQFNAGQFSKFRIKFKGLTNGEGSSVSLYVSGTGTNNKNIYTVKGTGEINQQTDHSIDIEEPPEKIWLSLVILIEPPVNGDGNNKFTRVSDLVIYGIR